MTRRRFLPILWMFLALLLAVQPFLPAPVRAMAEMRCAGAPPSSAPCVRAELAADGLTERKAYDTLMACCRSGRGECAMRQGGPAQRRPRMTPGMRLALTAAHRCLLSLRLSSADRLPLAPRRSTWFSAAALTLAPPEAHSSIRLFPPLVVWTNWTSPPILSLHSRPALHGLRAPPTAV